MSKVTDEQLQVIRERHRVSAPYHKDEGPAAEDYNSARAHRGQLLQVIRDRDATIADLREEISSVEHIGDLWVNGDSSKFSNSAVGTLLRTIRQHEATIAELRKPVAVQSNQKVESIRSEHSKVDMKCVERFLEPGTALSMAMPARLTKSIDALLSAYDTLAQDCARYANAHEVVMADNTNLLNRLNEERQRSNGAYKDWQVTHAGLEAEIAGLRERFEKACAELTRRETKIMELKERERQLREALPNLVDITWNEATESEQVPSSDWARRIIEKWGAALSQSQEPNSGRTPEQYAIEHGRYLANAAREFCDTLNQLAEAEMNADEESNGDLQHQYQLQAEELERSRNESYKQLQSCLYEFTKRADRAYPLKPKEPSNGPV